LLKEKNPKKLNKKLSLIASKMIKKLLNQNIDFKDFKKKKISKDYYHKWNWLNQNFFYVKKNCYHNLEKFVNASFNIPNNFNGPFIKLNNQKIVVRSCAIKKLNINLLKKNYLITQNSLILKTVKKNKYCFIKKFQSINNYNWNKNEIKSKIINNKFKKYFNEIY